MDLFIILKIIYFLLPGIFANILPVFFKRISFLNYPVDFGIYFGKERLFGDHKTFRGFFFGILGSIVFVFLQRLLYSFEIFKNFSLINYITVNFLVLGFLFGFGVLFGDLFGSFLKRRFGFRSGESFYILDQINGGLGIAFFVLPFYFKELNLILLIILLWTLGHFFIKYLGYLLGIEKKRI